MIGQCLQEAANASPRKASEHATRRHSMIMREDGRHPSMLQGGTA